MKILRNNWVRVLVLSFLGIICWETARTIGGWSILLNIAPIILGYIYLSKSIEKELLQKLKGDEK